MDNYLITIYQTPKGLLSGLLPELYDTHAIDKYSALASDFSEILQQPFDNQHLYFRVLRLELLERCDQEDFPKDFIELELEELWNWLSDNFKRHKHPRTRFMSVFFLETNTTLVVYKSVSKSTEIIDIPSESEILDLTQRLGLLV